MVQETGIKERVESWLAGYTSDADFFVESVEVFGDSVRVFIDRDGGITIDECAVVSRGLSDLFDAEGVDVSLEVSSPGLTDPMRNPRIFRKRIGSMVELLLSDRRKVRGVLMGYDGERVEVQVRQKELLAGHKRPEMVERTQAYALAEVQSVRVIFDK